MKQCSQCHKIKSLDQFYKASRMCDGYMSNCKACSSAATKRSRLKRPDHGWSDAKRAYRLETKRLVDDWKRARPCILCGENEPCCLELHHPDPSVKEGHPSNFRSISFKRYLREAEKCISVCSNCHKKVHAGIINIECNSGRDGSCASLKN